MNNWEKCYNIKCKYPKEHRYFTSADLSVIKRNTNRNAHTENYLFIAKKIGYPTTEIKKIMTMSKRAGYSVSPQETHTYYKRLMMYLKHKVSAKEYEAVYSRL